MNQAIIMAVLFVIYSNAAVVAVKFHGVPWVLGAAVPLALMIPLGYYLVVRREKVIVTAALPWIVVFVIIQTLGALFAKRPELAAKAVITTATEGLVLYFLVTNAVRTREMLRHAIWALLLAGMFLGGLSVFQHVTRTYRNDYGGFAQISEQETDPWRRLNEKEPEYVEIVSPRLGGSVGEKNRYAQMMQVLLPLGLFQFWNERSHRRRALAAIAMLLIAAAVALTLSRGAAVGVVAVFMVVVWMRYISLSHAIFILLALVTLLQCIPQYRERLASITTMASAAVDRSGTLESADNSTKSRVTEMLAAGIVFLDHPVGGVGPGMFPFYYRDYAERVGIKVRTANRRGHCLYLEVAAENGLPGLICYLGILLVTFRDLIEARRRWITTHPDLANMATGLLLGVIGYLVTGIFLHLAYVRYFWLIMALAGAAGCITPGQSEASRCEENSPCCC